MPQIKLLMIMLLNFKEIQLIFKLYDSTKFYYDENVIMYKIGILSYGTLSNQKCRSKSSPKSAKKYDST